MYILMNKDREAARFSLQTSSSDKPIFIRNENEPLPIGFERPRSWLANRKATKHNAHIKAIMRDCGCDNTDGFIRTIHAASLNDTFWVKKESENVTWNDISLYRNDFNETVSRLAFEGIGLYGIQFSDTSPEMSTEGSFRKCWIRRENGIYLYKRGSSGFVNSGMEPYCETMASEIAAILLGKNAVDYHFVHLHGEPASECRLFTNEAYGYVPVSKFEVDYGDPFGLLEFYSKFGNEDELRRMLVLDAVILNIDRHGGNFGLLVNNDTMEPIRMAPVFDLNMSLMPLEMKQDFNHIGRTISEKYEPKVGDDFTRVGQEMMTSEIRSDLINMKGFKFSFRGDEVFPEWRVNALEEIINLQINALLSRSRLYTSDVFASE